MPDVIALLSPVGRVPTVHRRVVPSRSRQLRLRHKFVFNADVQDTFSPRRLSNSRLSAIHCIELIISASVSACRRRTARNKTPSQVYVYHARNRPSPAVYQPLIDLLGCWVSQIALATKHSAAIRVLGGDQSQNAGATKWQTDRQTCNCCSVALCGLTYRHHSPHILFLHNSSHADVY